MASPIVRLCALLCALAGCVVRTHTTGHSDAGALAAQRVGAVVRRQTQQLVYVGTGGQTLVTTPEHPFATVSSGWVRAGELAAGDWLVSPNFGRVQVSFVRTESPGHSVPVFNLGVERTHAYLVGSEQVLVHNTRCTDGEDLVTRKTNELNQALDTLKALHQESEPTSREQADEREKRIAELNAQIKKLTKSLDNAKQNPKTRRRSSADSPRLLGSSMASTLASRVRPHG
jgi:Pretoxin HINT domain